MDNMPSPYFNFFNCMEMTCDQSAIADFRRQPRPFHVLSVFLEGKGEMYFGENRLTLAENDVFFIPKGTVYLGKWTALPRYKIFSLYYDYPMHEDPFRYKKTAIQKLNVDAHALLPLLETMRDGQRNDRIYPTLSAFFSACELCYPAVRSKEESSRQIRIQPALDYIESHFTEQLSVEFLAKLCYLSPPRFFAVFKAIAGCSPIRYKNNVCIQHVEQTLLTDRDRPVCEIAAAYGFRSDVYFRRVFKSVTGKTPVEFRKNPSFL